MWNSIFTSPRSCHSANSPRAIAQNRPAGELGLARILACEDGVTIIEFAPVLAIFLLLTFGIFDFGHLFFVELEVQTALQEAARYGSTGNHLTDPNTGLTETRVNSIINTFEADATGVNVTSIQISSLNGGSGSAGGPTDLLTVSATVTMPLMTPIMAPFFKNGKYSYTATTTVMNEPFSASNTN